MTWEELIEQTARELYEGKLTGAISPQMVKRMAGELLAGCFEGYGKSFETESLAAVDFEQLAAIEQNVFVFSGFKNYQQLRECSLLLKEGDKLRTFEDWFKDVLHIDNTYNKVYAKAEYQNALNTSNCISRWKDFEREADANPNLTWRAIAHDTLCPVCAALNGTTLPVGHPFWKTHGYPAHFLCYCLIEQSSKPVTQQKDIPAPVYPKGWEMFERNAGIDGIVFPEKHAYFETSKAAAKQIRAEVKKITPERK